MEFLIALIFINYAVGIPFLLAMVERITKQSKMTRQEIVFCDIELTIVTILFPIIVACVFRFGSKAYNFTGDVEEWKQIL